MSVPALLLSLSIGAFPIPVKDLPQIIGSLISPSSFPDIPPVYKDIILLIRLPRLLLALAVGAALSISGASLQALFKNPLVNEYILGISFGGAFGAALSLVFLGKAFPVILCTFLFSSLAVLLVLAITGLSNINAVKLILTGVIVTAFFQALMYLVQFFASPYELQAFYHWFMGSLSMATWKDIGLAAPMMALGMTILFLLRWRLNVLSMSDEEAVALGINIKTEKYLVIFAATLCTAAAVSVVGVIGWVGLIVPHIVRMLFGADNTRIIPLSAAMGGLFLLLADDILRGIASFEIPIGIFTSLIGIPLFIILLKRSGRIWL